MAWYFLLMVFILEFYSIFIIVYLAYITIPLLPGHLFAIVGCDAMQREWNYNDKKKKTNDNNNMN